MSPRHRQGARRWPSGRRERGCPGAAAGAARRCRARVCRPPAGSAPRLGQHGHHPGPQAAVAARGLRSWTRYPGRAPLFRSAPRSVAPGGGEARARRPHPRGSAVTLKSQLLSKWGQLQGRAKGQSATSSPPLAPGTPHPASELTSAHSAAGAGTRSKPQPHAGSLRGLRVAPASLRAGASRGRPEGVGPQKSRQFPAPPETARGARPQGRARAPPPLASTGRAARPAPAEPSAESPNWRTQDTAAAAPRAPTAPAPACGARAGGGGGPRRWRRRAGRGPRGPAAAPAPPPPPRASLSPELPGARLPGRRLVRAHRKGRGRLESGRRAGQGGGRSSHAGRGRRRRDPRASAPAGLAGPLHPGRR